MVAGVSATAPSRRAIWSCVLAWLFVVAVFALTITDINAGVAGSGDQNSPLPRVQARWLQYALESRERGRSAQLARIMRALVPRNMNHAAEARVYVSAKAERSGTVNDSDLLPLLTSPRQSDRLIAAAYGRDGRGWAQAVNELPRRGLVEWLARRSALRKLHLAAAEVPIQPIRDTWRRCDIWFGIVGWVLVAVYSFGVATKKITWSGHPSEPHRSLGGSVFAWRAGLLQTAYVLASLTPVFAVTLFPTLKQNIDRNTWTHWIYSAALLMLTIAVVALPIGGSSLAVGAAPRKFLGWIVVGGWGLGGVFCAMALTTAAGTLRAPLSHVFTYVPSLSNRIDVPFDWWRITPALLSACIVAPICEELAFRGALLPALASLFRQRWVRIPVAVIGSSIVFAAGHSYGVPAWPEIIAIGAVQSVLVFQTRSLLPAILCHALYNGWIEYNHVAIWHAAFPLLQRS